MSRSLTDVAATPGAAIARGSPLPMFTPVSGFSPSGSRSRIRRATQPSVEILSGSQVCQMSMPRKCERMEFS